MGMFIAVLFIEVKKGKLPKCPSEIKWISKMWHILTMQYYTAKRISELQRITTQINFFQCNIEQGSQTRRSPYYVIPFLY